MSGTKFRPVLIAAFLAFAFSATASPIVAGTFHASLDTGGLAGVSFPVSFSYDSGQVLSVGDSYVTLASFDFVLLGIPFDRSEIFQGGQAIFHNGMIDNVTASYQVFLPPISPVDNITFGFGGPGIIGYIDLNNEYGMGSFTFASVPEPATYTGAAAAIFMTLTYLRRKRHLQPGSRSTQTPG